MKLACMHRRFAPALRTACHQLKTNHKETHVMSAAAFSVGALLGVVAGGAVATYSWHEQRTALLRRQWPGCGFSFDTITHVLNDEAVQQYALWVQGGYTGPAHGGGQAGVTE